MKRILAIVLMLSLLCGCTAPGGGHGHEEGDGHQHSESDGRSHDETSPSSSTDEHGSGEEGYLILTAAQRQEVGLKTAPLTTGASQGIRRSGRVEADPDRRVVVSPQVSGTIKHLPVIVGSQVRQGDLVAVLDSPEVTVLKGEYHNAEVEADLAAKELENTRQLLAVGDESRREVEEAKLELAKAQANRDGVKARLESATLAEERLQQLRSEGIASAQQVEEAVAVKKALEADLREAKSAVTIAEQHLRREQRVARSQLREKAETFPAEANLARARESIKHAEERLRQLGADPEQSEGAISLLSPIDGQVVERPVTRGQVVSAGETIAVLVDPSQVWVWIDLQRADLAHLNVGDPVTVQLASDPSVQASGEISHIDAQVSAQTQTVRARVTLRSSGAGRLRVGSFVNAHLRAGQDREPLIPSQAVVEVEGQTVVYRVDGEGFRRSPVEVVFSDGDSVAVRGLPEGSQVVIQGASDLKSIDLAGTIGGHHH
jgi:RND family efflux transporter MFP subunit